MILHVNSCVRKNSRTKKLADALISTLGNDVEEIRLIDEDLHPMSEEKIMRRAELASKKDFSDDMFRFARQFASAETIVISAPFWDLSFPSILKVYVENIYVTGLVSEYDSEGRPHGLCNAKKLYFVSTAGGPFKGDYSFSYFKDLAQNFFGIPEVKLIYAENLDVAGNDADAIMSITKKNILP